MNNKIMEDQKITKQKITLTNYNNIYIDEKKTNYYSFKVMLNINRGVTYKKSFKSLKRAILDYNSIVLTNNLEEKHPIIPLKNDKIIEQEEREFINNFRRRKLEI